MSSASIQINSQGQFGALEKYVALLQQIIGLQALMRAGGSSGLGGGTGAASGRAPPPPSTPGGGAPPGGGGSSAGGGAPPPPPPSSPGGGGGGAPPPPSGGGGGGGGAPPPPPGGGGGSGSPWPGQRKPEGPEDFFDYGGRRYIPNAWGTNWQVAPRPAQPPSFMSQAGRFVGGVAQTAIGVAIGGSIQGLAFASVERYFQLSKALAEVNQRFREASDGASLFGTQMGYTIGQSVEMAQALGATTNTFDGADGTRLSGFARYVGLGRTPGTVLQAFGRLGSLSGRGASFGDADLALALSRAQGMGMDQGRIGEFLQRMTEAAEGQFAATGRASLEGALGAVALPSVVYGEGDPRRSNDTSLTGGLNTVMQSTPGRSLLMRAMGYGRGGLSYIDMKKRLDAGIFDAQNVTDMFGYMQRMGLSRTGQFQALESLAGGSLKANQIEALIDSLGTPGGLADYQRMMAQSPEDAQKALAKALGGKGFTELGKGAVSLGEQREAALERIQFSIGKELAPMVAQLTAAADRLVRALETGAGPRSFQYATEQRDSVSRMTPEEQRAETYARQPDWLKPIDAAIFGAPTPQTPSSPYSRTQGGGGQAYAPPGGR